MGGDRGSNSTESTTTSTWTADGIGYDLLIATIVFSTGAVIFVVALTVILRKSICRRKRRRRAQVDRDVEPAGQRAAGGPAEPVYDNIINLAIRSEPLYADLEFSGDAAPGGSRQADRAAADPRLCRRGESLKPSVNKQTVGRSVFYSQIPEGTVYACIQPPT